MQGGSIPAQPAETSQHGLGTHNTNLSEMSSNGSAPFYDIP